MRNGRTPAGFRPNGLRLGRQSRCRLAPSNPRKTKLDAWVGLEWVGLEACGGGWMELIGLGCRNMADGWTRHYSWKEHHSRWTWPIRNKGKGRSSIGGHASKDQHTWTWPMNASVGTCTGWWPMNAPVGTCTKMRWCSHWTELARRQGSQCFTLPLRLPLR